MDSNIRFMTQKFQVYNKSEEECFVFSNYLIDAYHDIFCSEDKFEDCLEQIQKCIHEIKKFAGNEYHIKEYNCYSAFKRIFCGEWIDKQKYDKIIRKYCEIMDF